MTTAMRFDFDYAVTNDHDVEIHYTVTADMWPGSPAITLGNPDDCAPADPPQPEILKIRDIVDVEIPICDWPADGLRLADLEEAALEHYYPMVRE